VAARAPITFDYAIENKCNIMTWPLTKDMSEAQTYKNRLDDAIAKSDGTYRPNFAMMRHASVYKTDADRDTALQAVRYNLSQFGNLMMKAGDVQNGFPDPVPLEKLDGNAFVEPNMIEQNLLFGSPDVVVQKLKAYQALGVDSFIYFATMGLDRAQQKRSMQAFIDDVMPEFA
jgi:alkanesulfonate monooxygenase SsuD/methylene tetrahydromethanopterin reductase-like flavin-dependent oxidoreductase (luciferase family)